MGSALGLCVSSGCYTGEGKGRKRDKKRVCLLFYCHHGTLLIRVKHGWGQPDLLKKYPSQCDTDRGFSSSFIGDSHSAILYGEQLIEDT